ncbi:MAG TPA: S4 domain-containing protein [Dongiaceae bacterium]|nr:S4 domain-containing protein [Dongiaceae bacterium]
MSGPTLRLDKWLWHARFCKSRTLAARLAAAGKVRISGSAIWKAHHPVRPGDVLTFPLGPHIRTVRILALGERRGPAPEARGLYEDLAPPPALPAAGGPRPTKAGRRALDRLRGGEEA